MLTILIYATIFVFIMEQKKNVVNFRPMVIVAILVIISSIIATNLSFGKHYLWITFFILILFFVLMLALGLLNKLKILFSFAMVLLVCSIPFLNMIIRVNNQGNISDFNGDNFVVQGRISENYELKSGTNVKLCIDEIVIIDGDKKFYFDGKLNMYVNASNMNPSEFYIGRYVEANAYLNLICFENDASDKFSMISNDVIGTASVKFGTFKFVGENKIHLRDTIKNSVRNMLEISNNRFISLGYSMLFGDKTVLEEDIQTAFQTTGIAHLLAVSGLHVSIIVYIVSKILQKLKVSGKIQFIILILSISFYSYLCEFSVSVVRAGLMAIILSYSKLRGKAYDPLSVLALVAVILLLINPLNIHNVSFVLSFSSVLSIFLLSNSFKRFFSKFFYEGLASLMALNCSVQIGLTLTTAYFFKKVNFLSMICNFISVPVATACFVFFIFALVIVAILPFVPVFEIYGFFMGIVVKFNALSAISNAIIYFSSFSIIYDVMIKCLMFIMSDYYFSEKQTKLVAGLIAIATCLQVCLPI